MIMESRENSDLNGGIEEPFGEHYCVDTKLLPFKIVRVAFNLRILYPVINTDSYNAKDVNLPKQHKIFQFKY